MTLPSLSTGQWQTILGIAAAVNAFLLASDMHPDVKFGPWVLLVLGALNVAFAVIKTSGDDEPA